MGARKILSVNALYNAKMTWVNGRQVATIYKTGEAKQTEAYIREQVERLDVPVNYPWVNIGKIPWRRAWQSTPIFLPGESHGQRSLVGYSP